MKLTAKQERFCQEIALNNKTQTEAYKEAYNTNKMKEKTIQEASCVLAKDYKVATRIDELRATLQKEIMTAVRYDKEACFQEIELARQLAMTPKGEHGNINENAVIKATELKGKLCGLFLSEVDVEVEGSRGITVKILTNG